MLQYKYIFCLNCMQNTDLLCSALAGWSVSSYSGSAAQCSISESEARHIFNSTSGSAGSRSFSDRLLDGSSSVWSDPAVSDQIWRSLIPCNITHIIPASSCEIFYFQNSFYHLSRNLVHVRVEKSPTRRDQYRYSYFPSPFILLSQRVKVKR